MVAPAVRAADNAATDSGQLRTAARAALAGLTIRGRCLLAAGITCCLTGMAAGERDLVRIGVLLIALPVLAAAVVARTRYRLTCRRTLMPQRLPAGGDATVELVLQNISRLPTSVLLLEDELPYQLGARPRFVVDRVEAGGTRTVRYPVSAAGRGRYTIGPLSVRLTDPFGFCELTRSFTASTELLVTPQVWQLPGIRLGGEWAGGGGGQSASVASTGEDDVAPRQYHVGDDLRRIHWRMTARTGELMVRREEQPWQSRATVLLDVRTDAHAGTGTLPGGSSFEWAVAAAASITVHLARSGFALSMVHGGWSVDLGGGAGSGASWVDAEALAMADLASVADDPDAALMEDAERLGSRSGTVIAVLGRLTRADARQLSRVRLGPGGTATAILLDTRSWLRPAAGASPTVRIEQPGPVQPADQDVVEARDLLSVAGWRVVVADRDTPLPETWALLDAGRSARRGAR